MTIVSRTSRSLKNARVAIVFYLVNLLLQFFSRKIFLDYLGSEVLGLNTTAQNLIGCLNLAELGIGTAVAYNLYKPLYEDDKETVNGIVSMQGWMYRRIAAVILAGSIILMCFFPMIFSKAEVPLWYAYGSFGVLLFSSLLGYFVNYRQIVLSADQKEYKVTTAIQGVKVLKVLVQIFAIRFFSHGYLWWMVLEALFAIITSLVLNKTIKTEYPWLKTQIGNGLELRKKYSCVITKTKQLFFHKIGSFVLTQTSPIIIYAYASLSLVAIYGNYMLIVTGVTMLVNSLLNGIAAGVGNLVAEGNKPKIKNFFWELTSLRMWMAATICFVIYALGHSFMKLWIGAEFLMPESAFIVLIAITFVQLTRTSDTFLAAYGLFQDIWAPIVEASLNLGLSILLGHFFGLTGILLGVLISLLVVVYTWKPYFLFTQGFNESAFKYFLRLGKYLLILIFTFVCSKEILEPFIGKFADSWPGWGLCAVAAILFNSIFSLVILWFADEYSRLFVRRLLSIVRENINTHIHKS